MNKGNSTIFALVGVAVLVLSALVAYSTASGLVKQSSAIMGGIVNVGQRDFPDGISVDGTEIISGTGGISPTTGDFSTSLSVGDGTDITEIICTATTTDWAAFAGSNCQSGTTSMTGLTYSLNGGWNFSISPVATTSGIESLNYGMILRAYSSSTDIARITICNSSTTNVNLPAQRYEICAVKH